MAGTPTVKAEDLWLWLAANEEQLLLHSGLTRLIDHIPVPSGVAEVTDNDPGLPAMDGRSTRDLAEIILRECGAKTTTYASLMEYRRNALRGFWSAVRLREREQQQTPSGKETSSSSSSSDSQSSPSATAGSTGLASRMCLVLVFLSVKSLSRFDPTLSSEAARGLLECLRVYEPLSLSGEQMDCVQGAENLLHSWLVDTKEGGVPLVQNAASALVALSVAV